MRISLILAGALAVIGAFFVVLQILWMLHVDVHWLPYVAHGVGAAIAGAAIARSAQPHSLREPFAAGVLAIAALAITTFVKPSVFMLTAARGDARWTVLPFVLAGSGLACAGGAWLFRAGGGPTRRWIAVLAALTIACALQLGARFGLLLGVPVTITAMTIEMGVLAVLAGAATQAVVAVDAVVACAIGGAAFVLLGILGQVSKGMPLDGSSLLPAVITLAGAGLGAYLVWRARR